MIDTTDKNKVGRGKNSRNETNLSNPSSSKKSTGAGYLTYRGSKKSGGNTKKGVKAARDSDYLISDAKNAFNYLRHTFTQAPILQHFDLERHIRIETDASGYAVGGVLSQLILDDLGWWHPVAYYSLKMILAKTSYKTHDAELLAIVEVFKTWRHYLKACKYKVLVLTNHNKLCRFMDMKILSFY